MGKISKYSNLYNKDGEFLHAPGNYTIQEVEDLLDSIEDKNSQAYQNTMAVLMQMYEKHGNPHKDEILQKLTPTTQASPKISDYASPKTTKAEVVNALNDLKMESRLTPEKRKKYQELLEMAQKNPEEYKSVIQIVSLALQLDEKGEYWKFKEVFGHEASEV